LYLDDEQTAQGRPRLAATDHGLVATPGHSHFTTWKFADLQHQDGRTIKSWTLEIEFWVPEDARYSNSGIYLVFADPKQDLEVLPPAARAAFNEAYRAAENRKQELGDGPFELDFFGYEVQIVSQERPDVPANQRTGSVYTVPVGKARGQQSLHSSFEPLPGGKYRFRLSFYDGALETYVSDLQASGWQLVSKMQTKTREEDPVRGGLPIALLLQAYANDGQATKSFVFRSIRLTY
jgi:hypothetical protein